MRPPVSYYGGKSRLAGWVASLLPPHRVYLEPFAGSCAVLLAKPCASHEIINDLDGDVVNFFRCLRDHEVELERLCRLTPYAREEFDAADLTDAVDDLERARRWWVRATQSINAQVTAHKSFSVSTSRGSGHAWHTLTLVARFAAVAARIRTAVIECRPAVEVIAKHAGPDTVVYADPPYLAATRSMLGRKTREYTHEYASESDHRTLAEVLHATPAAVLLSGYPSPLYDELYAGWQGVERRVHRPSSNAGGRDVRALEVVWSNRALPAQQRLAFQEVLA
ncbi:MAG: DNA adenine methylase [Egibacteraceae bacterium]